MSLSKVEELRNTFMVSFSNLNLYTELKLNLGIGKHLQPPTSKCMQVKSSFLAVSKSALCLPLKQGRGVQKTCELFEWLL